jgi:hypothetical protein
VHDHVVAWLVGLAAGCLATVAVAIATRVRVLPEVIDVSLVPTMADVFSILFAAAGAARRLPPDRIGRLTLFGTLLGSVIALLLLVAPMYSRDVFPIAMWRFLAPYLVIVAAIMIGAAVAYAQGAPAWVIHGGGVLSALVLAPAVVRWENRPR